jgi:hypothetical protein
MFVSLEQQKLLLHDGEFLLDLIVYSDTYRASLTRNKMPVIKSRAFNLENVSYDTHKDIDVRGFGEYFGVCVTS